MGKAHISLECNKLRPVCDLLDKDLIMQFSRCSLTERKFMQYINFVNFGLILQNVSQMPSESTTIIKCPTKFPWILLSFIFKSQDIPESVSRHSHECRLVLFSHQISSHELFALFFHSRLLCECDIHTTFMGVWHINCIVNSQRFGSDRIVTLVQLLGSRFAITCDLLLNVLSQKFV